MPHHSENGGHEMSDFSWTTVLWLLPLSVIVLLVFFYVCIFWFKSAKDNELAQKQSQFQTPELNEYHAKESEILNRYKVLDKDKGRVQIPIALAMELVAREHQDRPGREWVPITDTYLEGAAFAAPASAPAPEADIRAENAPEDRSGAKPAPAEKAPQGKAAQPAQNSAADKGATKTAPGVAPEKKGH